MIRKLDFFLNLYDKRKEIFDFLITVSYPLYHRPMDILIKNSIPVSFEIKNNIIFYCDNKKYYQI